MTVIETNFGELKVKLYIVAKGQKPRQVREQNNIQPNQCTVFYTNDEDDLDMIEENYAELLSENDINLKDVKAVIEIDEKRASEHFS